MEVLMRKKYSKHLKKNLFSIIDDMSKKPGLFVKNPNVDFTRKRKLDFKTFMHLSLSMESGSIRRELLKYFKFNQNVVTPSAYVQQRSKLLPEAFDYLFHEFVKTVAADKTLKGYRLLACDGSNISLPPNPNDPDNYIKKPNERAYGRCHLNAMYDIENRIYVDVLIQTCRQANENRALVDLIDRSIINNKVILLADRGYESYNVLAHLKEKNWKYVIRIKDTSSSGGIASGFDLPEGSFDIDFNREIIRSQRVFHTQNSEKYKSIYYNTVFDYLQNKTDTYPISFRIVRFPISDGKYETIITNLDREEFSVEEIKELYSKRWDIETSFRELKYNVGLSNFRSKKAFCVLQEIYSRLIVFNFCESIVANTIVKERKSTIYIYQCNITNAIDVCKYFLSCKKSKIPSVEDLILSSLNPVRPGRSYPRILRNRPNICFNYRISQ